MKRFLIAAILSTLLYPSASAGHEPIFGVGPHTIFKGGVGVEVEFEGREASGAGEEEEELLFHTEIIYGLTTDTSLTLAVPYIIDSTRRAGGTMESSSGLGDISLRTKYRFWRRDGPGVQDAAAVVVGIKTPTGDDGSTPRLGSGSTDYLFALTAARESLVWYYFGDIRYKLNTEGGGGLKAGDRILADLAIGARPWPTEYLKPDIVFMGELNWERYMRDETGGVDVADSGGDRLFISPSFFFTYRNLAVKGGVQIPVYQDLHGEQSEEEYRFKLAVEFHF